MRKETNLFWDGAVGDDGGEKKKMNKEALYKPYHNNAKTERYNVVVAKVV